MAAETSGDMYAGVVDMRTANQLSDYALMYVVNTNKHYIANPSFNLDGFQTFTYDTNSLQPQANSKTNTFILV